MKKFIAPLLALLVSGCQIDPYTHAPTLTSTDWYDVGMELSLIHISEPTRH